MKIMCNFCGKVLDLMASTSLAAEENGQLKTYNFCSEEHLREFAGKKGMPIGKN